MTNLNTALTNKSGISLNIEQAERRLFKEVTDGSRRPFTIAGIKTVNFRQNVWQYNWGNGDPWTTYHNYLTGAGSSADPERAFWFGLGTNTRQNTLSYSSTDDRLNARINYAKNSVLGGEAQYNTITNNTAVGPFSVQVMFLRNHHPSTQQSVTMWGHYNNWWSNGTEGSGVAIGTPNVNNSYSTVSDISWSVPTNRTGGNSSYTHSWTVNIPSRTTVAVLQTSSMYYWQNSGGYQWWEANKFYNLDSTFSNFWVQPDLQMLYAAQTYNDHNNEFNSRNSYRVWRRTAELYGERP